MPDFIRVASTAELKPGAALAVDVKGKTIALFNVAGKVFATDNTCLHQGGPLAEGTVDGEVVTCPWHQWEYNVRTGLNLDDESLKLETYPVEIEGTDIKVAV